MLIIYIFKVDDLTAQLKKQQQEAAAAEESRTIRSIEPEPAPASYPPKENWNWSIYHGRLYPLVDWLDDSHLLFLTKREVGYAKIP